MPAQWTGEIIGEMHMKKVTTKRLAQELGYTPEYVSMVLNGHREPKCAEAVFRNALAQITAASENTGDFA